MTRGTTRRPTAHRLRDVLRETVTPLLPRGEPYALLGYPAYPNVGDNAIWLGALALLDARQAGPPSYMCTEKTYDAEALRRAVRGGPILLTGGGNFGDLYPRHQRLRERVVRDFPGNRIVQLPQTIEYERDEAAAESRRVLEAHPDLTVLVRDEASLRVCRDQLGVEGRPCPDLAFALAPLRRPEPMGQHVVWLLREDHERRARGGLEEPGSSVDWPPDPRRGLFALQRRLRRIVARSPARHPHLAGTLQRTFRPAARRRLHRGCALLASGRAVVTDRLHGHILSLLMGIPHVLLDNDYGKNRGFHERWTRDAPEVRWSDGPLDACRGLLGPEA